MADGTVAGSVFQSRVVLWKLNYDTFAERGSCSDPVLSEAYFTPFPGQLQVCPDLFRLRL
jgi:hypothetical protein